MKKCFITTLVFLCFVVFTSFGSAVEDFVKQDRLKRSQLGVCVMDIATGEVIAESGMNEYLTPASTLKVVTSATAQRILGSDYRYSTKVYIDGKIDNKGVLNGVVRIVGSGDPSLGSKEFADQPAFVDTIVSLLKAKGITGINGGIVTDGSVFETPAYSLDVQVYDVALGYGAGAFGVNFADNIFDVCLNFSGRYAKIKNTNPLIDIAFSNNIRISNRKSARGLPSMVRGIDSNSINFTGTVAKLADDRFVTLSNPNPEQLLRDSLILSIRNSNIQFKSNANVSSSNSELILDYKSPRLSEILNSLLVRSDNMFTDCVLRTLAVNAGKSGSLENGVEVVMDYWKSRGIDTANFMMFDGSGLTRDNKLTAKLLADILVDMNRNDDAQAPFYTLFPIAGVNGTVKSLLKDTDYAGEYALKSGSVSQVQCFAGYYPASAPKYAVVVLTTFYSCSRAQVKEAIEQLLIGIGEELKK